MGLSAEQLKVSLDALSKIEPRFAVALSQVGYPEPRVRARGYETLLRTIVGQQVSFQAAASVWAKLEAARGDMTDPHAVIDASFDDLRACGLSRQKQGYARSLAELVKSGALDLHNLPSDDEEAIARLTQVKGIGRWSAEIYLLFAEGRPDIWPAGDLAVQIDVGQIMGLPERPGERQVREIGEAWRPHRGAAAVFAWHHYKTPGI
ncbi:MAG: DNA-3-methyladenine glycosylase 2 family protein [Sphingomonadales bacterium]|nr:DNA-3-methyladenine glycosylase 2 family protein [Sphingomonadales bacterium]MBL0000705.1 DNA-3-methyladenine glycosylase 2 family protein [Sphingomonadales bacterium]MBL0115432.1 DNA-3-methyladenine glycosylase 2 family protein [Sphingomonadales bacterium]